MYISSNFMQRINQLEKLGGPDRPNRQAAPVSGDEASDGTREGGLGGSHSRGGGAASMTLQDILAAIRAASGTVGRSMGASRDALLAALGSVGRSAATGLDASGNEARAELADQAIPGWKDRVQESIIANTGAHKNRMTSGTLPEGGPVRRPGVQALINPVGDPFASPNADLAAIANSNFPQVTPNDDLPPRPNIDFPPLPEPAYVNQGPPAYDLQQLGQLAQSLGGQVRQGLGPVGDNIAMNAGVIGNALQQTFYPEQPAPPAPWYQNADIQRAGIGAGIGGLGGLGLGYVMGADSPWEYLGYGAGGAGLGAAGGYFGDRVLNAAKGLIGSKG